MEYDVEHRGSGRPLVLLHSGFCTWVEFRRLIDDLALDHEVLAPTLPGSLGGPPLDVQRPMLEQHVDYVQRLLDDLAWSDDVTVVGSSFGGVAALQLNARGRSGSVVALAPPWTSGAGVAFYGALFSGIPAIGLTRPLWSRTTKSGLINGLWFHQSRTPPEIDPDDVAILLESWSRFPIYRVGAAAGRRGPGMPELSKIDQASTTLVWGGRDAFVPGWMRRRWADALPQAHETTLPGYPHQPHLRSPDAVAALIRSTG
ncbi:pimeloyl-ACP methyl ester carboxylesterase [Marmoricola sp. OAE513]|uniref:alpha/beta fold hydrolase n=1 Tax=Marmoricola sp. OAE513 TaxID=2817894 RepID=UPI001AE7CBD8